MRLLFSVALAWTVASSAVCAVPGNAAPGVKYVGSRICSGCHAAIYRSYVATEMGRSMSMAQGNGPELPASVRSDLLNRDFRVYSENGALYQAESEVKDGQRIFDVKYKAAYAIGSGANGVSFAVERPGGYLFQAPLSFYAHTGTWQLSPGFEQADLGFERPIYAACITCHAGRPNPVPGREGLFQKPAFDELAIGCENCHGPGEIHVAERAIGMRKGTDNSIVNPAQLEPRLAEDICMKCHQGGDARALEPGKQYSDFRPGMPLIESVAIASLPLTSGRSDLLQHHVAMKLSACFRGSGGKLSCLTCHDPHVEPTAERAAGYYKSRCLTCHTEASCKAAKALRASNKDNCIACHMEKRDVKEIAHSALTNHTIPRTPDAAPATLELPDSHVGGLDGLLLLNANGLKGEVPMTTRLELYGQLAPQSPAILKRYWTLLDEAAKTTPDNPAVLAAMGRRSLTEKKPDAVDLLARAATAESASEATLTDYSEALDAKGRMEDALAVLERAAKQFPYSKEIGKRRILHYIQLKRYAEARQAMTEYISSFPEDDFMRGLLAQVQ